MTISEIYNTVREHLLRQNRAAIDPDDDSCRYRGPSGLRCAVGCLIKDEFYSSKLEGLTVREKLVQSALEKSGIDTSDGVIDLLTDLQDIHDSVDSEKWLESLDGLRNNLNDYEVVD